MSKEAIGRIFTAALVTGGGLLGACSRPEPRPMPEPTRIVIPTSTPLPTDMPNIYTCEPYKVDPTDTSFLVEAIEETAEGSTCSYTTEEIDTEAICKEVGYNPEDGIVPSASMNKTDLVDGGVYVERTIICPVDKNGDGQATRDAGEFIDVSVKSLITQENGEWVEKPLNEPSQ